MTSSSTPRCVLIQPAGGLLPWQRACLDLLAGELGVVLTGIVTTGAADNGGKLATRWLDRLTRPRSACRRLPYAATEKADRHTAGEPLTQTDIEWINACRPDFVLVFDAVLPTLAAARFAAAGVWWFTEGGTPADRIAPPARAALARGDTRLTLSLWAQTGTETSPTVIAQAHTPAVAHSRKRSLARLYEIAPDLLRRGVDGLRAGHGPPLETPLDRIDAPAPTSWACFVVAMTRTTVRRWLEKLWLRQRWDIGLIAGRVPVPDAHRIATAHWLPGPQSGFWADPCLVADTDEPILLVEEYRDDTGRGEITSLAWAETPANTAPTARPVLRLDGHLSFPRSYIHAGDRWLIPEMAACGEQHAYRLDDQARCIDAPPVAITGLAGIDPVLFAHAGRYWAFVSPAGRRANYQLDLYMADDFFGPYRRHPASPVRIDPHGGRCAGPVIRDGQRLLRFGQVFGRHYGEAIDVFEITALTAERYAERRIDRIRLAPDTGSGMHSIDFSDQLTVIDRFRLEPVWRILFRRLSSSRAG